jgi:hypothetical protein
VANKLSGDFPNANVLLAGGQIFQANINLPKNVRLLYSFHDLTNLVDQLKLNS